MDAQFYQELLDSLSDGVYFIDKDRRVTYWNKAAERLSGYTADEIMGKRCADNFLRHVDELGTELCVKGCPLAATMSDGQSRESNVFMHHKFGHRVPVYVRASPMHDEAGNIIGAVEIFSENGKQLNILKEIEGLRKEILTDQLTSIGNRRYADITMDRLDHSMEQNSIPFGILFADIDHFKRVNDTWGHHVGDQVITMVAQSLKTMLRPLDIVCRWGGEEFVIFVPNTTEAGLATMAERLKMLVSNSWVEHVGERISVTISLGGAISKSGEKAESVLDRADKQVYLSKERGRDCIHINDARVAD